MPKWYNKSMFNKGADMLNTIDLMGKLRGLQEKYWNLDTLKTAGLVLLIAAGTSIHRSADASEFSGCTNQFAFGSPPLADFSSLQARALCFDGFAVLHSGLTKTPIFSAEHLTADRVYSAGSEPRTNNFYEEARLPSNERASLRDYQGTGFDRGHMSPAADMSDQNMMAQSFSLANMVPQAPDNNRGIWADIEKDTRKYVKRSRHDVFVLTGPVFAPNHATIGHQKVWVPDYLYKLVYDAQDDRAWAYWVDNTNGARMSRPISYDELVNRVGYPLLAKRPAN